ncbi:MAG: DUF2892 domain-containing protein [Candidatus Eisenbacteria bacterium]|uniref:DUF2892 domain-containing protein n=1 Tax=Eiseniibacteriota bacterium TaxID=2212470 RepID=A0A956N8U5_UNCEI|nr:DUF2892 domain-containing protein [Candidatus Eisenbacteria bacterium]MCB9464929.1 DUF2892 domain-containing protein [Candidatus Eisenbacteria bacterium]
MTVETAIRRLAGTLVLAGLALGWWVHPGFYLLVAFVGLNLLQSSFTGFCPAETILKKLGVGGACAVPNGKATPGVR